MRVLIVSQYFHPENFRINQLAVALKENGHKVVVLTGQPNYPSGQFFPGYSFFRPLREKYQEMEVIRVPVFPRGQGRAWQLILNYVTFVFFATVFGLPRLRGRFDVCISWCSSPITGAIPASIYRFFRGTPLAVWVQDLWPETFFAVTGMQNRTMRTLLSGVVRWIYNHTDQIWIQSPAYEPSVRAHGGLSHQVEFVPNWAEDLYDCDRWDRKRAELLPENSIVFAGNLGRAQGLEGLLDAVDLCRKMDVRVHWILVGDGSLRPWLESEVQRRGLGDLVKLLPRRPAADMPALLMSASAVLVTLGDDQVYRQTIPSKVQSCLASGRPVIGVLSGESARVIRMAKAGPICPPGAPLELANKVKEFLALPEEEKQQLGRNGHAYYKANYTQAGIVTSILKLIERLEQLGRLRRTGPKGQAAQIRKS